MDKEKIIQLGSIAKDGRLHFARFEDRSFLSVEPKGDNKVYIMCWSDMEDAIVYASIANLPEDVGIVSIDVTQMPGVMSSWPDDQLFMLDRQLDGSAKILRMKSIKEGKFTTASYQGEPPDVNIETIDPEIILL